MRRALLAALLLFGLPAAANAAGPPLISYELNGTAGDAGWYVSTVTVAWTVNWNGGVPILSDGCEAALPVTGDTTPTGTTRSCTAESSLGEVSVTTGAFRIDRTKPTVTGAAPARATDHAGWFNHPVDVGFTGSDASSGLAGCTAKSYGGPDSAGASVSGTCRDNAGNVSAPTPVALKYDATAPQVTGLSADRPADHLSWFVRPVTLSFTGSDATSGLEGCDSISYAGPDSPSAPVSGACRDVAGNATAATLPIEYDATAPSLTQLAAVAGDSIATLSWNPGDASVVRITRRPGPVEAAVRGQRWPLLRRAAAKRREVLVHRDRARRRRPRQLAHRDGAAVRAATRPGGQRAREGPAAPALEEGRARRATTTSSSSAARRRS